MTQDLVSTLDPLQPEYIPAQFVNRDNLQTALNNLVKNDGGRNAHIQGPQGMGKTHLMFHFLNRLEDKIEVCYIDCSTSDTMHKVLKQMYSSVCSGEISDGHHTSTLQRSIEEQIETTELVLVLDEIDFLLLNDGEDLLYFLSRMDHTSQINIITVSNRIKELRKRLEERTYSSLQPYPFQVRSYNQEEKFRILLKRAQDALKSQTLQRQALTAIATETSNLRFGIQWLKTAAIEADKLVTKTLVQEVRQQAYTAYANRLLSSFSDHHKLLYQAIRELDEEQTDTIQTGEIYSRYHHLCKTYSQEGLTNRRLSSYVKQLELLGVISSEYHYGGKTGKTREIKLKKP